MKKHRQQMKREEIAALESHVRKLDCKAIGQHAADRMREKGVSAAEIADCLSKGAVIEIHNETGEWRMLLRHYRATDSVCAVFSLAQRAVVTVWRNDNTDSHRTLDARRYQFAGLNIFGLLAVNFGG